MQVALFGLVYIKYIDPAQVWTFCELNVPVHGEETAVIEVAVNVQYEDMREETLSLFRINLNFIYGSKMRSFKSLQSPSPSILNYLRQYSREDGFPKLLNAMGLTNVAVEVRNIQHTISNYELFKVICATCH